MGSGLPSILSENYLDFNMSYYRNMQEFLNSGNEDLELAILEVCKMTGKTREEIIILVSDMAYTGPTEEELKVMKVQIESSIPTEWVEPIAIEKKINNTSKFYDHFYKKRKY